MAVRGFDVFDQMAAAAVVAGTTPRTQTAQPAPTPQAAPTPTRKASRGANRFFVAFVYIGVFAGLSFLAAAIVAMTPLGAINLAITQPFLATVAVAVMLTIIAVARA